MGFETAILTLGTLLSAGGGAYAAQQAKKGAKPPTLAPLPRTLLGEDMGESEALRRQRLRRLKRGRAGTILTAEGFEPARLERKTLLGE